jgi:hypothetical protein
LTTTIDTKNPTKNVVTEGVATKVTMTASWAQFRSDKPVARPGFDPRAAGRRTVDKHSDALRRLSS